MDYPSPVSALLPILIPDQVRQAYPSLELHSFLFEAARIGVGHRGLDPLRSRAVERLVSRAAKAGTPEDLPELGAFRHLFPGRAARHYESSPHRRLLLGALNREPFVVRNDAADLGHLVALFFGWPTLLLDAGRLRGPLLLTPCPESFVLPTTDGPRPGEDVLVLADHEKALRSLGHDLVRAPVLESTRRILVCILNPGLPDPNDVSTLDERVQNWFQSLLQVKLLDARRGTEGK